ncbi:glycoside hydrolase family 95-like protein [Rhizobium sp. LjRoot258]|uniref:glycoside hydrolase family 95-like protein n=1 Tax=Rhizobium sp. LjRoot258 TaxID=3342299 RepID=UPI003F5046D0
MLMQSRPQELHLLPALPREWPIGSLLGLRVRGVHDARSPLERRTADEAETLGAPQCRNGCPIRRCQTENPGLSRRGRRDRIRRSCSGRPRPGRTRAS